MSTPGRIDMTGKVAVLDVDGPAARKTADVDGGSSVVLADPAVRRERERFLASRRIGRPEEVASVVAFLTRRRRRALTPPASGTNLGT